MRLRLTTLLLAMPLLAAAQPVAPPPDSKTIRAASPLHKSDQPFSEGFLCSQVHRSIRLLNPQPQIGEPLLFEIRLEGFPEGPQPADFAQPLRVGADLRVFVQPAKGQPYELTPDKYSAGFIANTAFSLRKEETTSMLLVLGHDSESVTGAIFDRAGDYLLTVTMLCQEMGNPRPVEHTLGEFMVRPIMPQRGDDNIALNSLLDAKSPKIFQSLEALELLDPKFETYYQAVLDSAPEAALRPYAMLVLANGYWAKTLRKDPPAEAVKQAVARFEQFLKEYPEHPYRGIVMMRLIQTYKLADQPGKARELAIKVWRDPELTHLIRPETELYKEIAGEVAEPVTGDWMIYNEPSDAMKGETLTPDEENALKQAVQQALQQQGAARQPQ